MALNPYNHRAALIIGIDKYQDAAYPDLQCACNDALLFNDVLVSSCGFERSNITVLLNTEATLNNIRRQAETTGQSLSSHKSQLIIFFAGHGETISLLGDKELGFFVPFDGERASIYSTCISMQEIVTLCEIIYANHLLFILDCCFSGLVGVTTRATTPKLFVEKMVTMPSRQIMTAGMSNETAAESPSLGHGLYSFSLCQALQNPDFCKKPYLTASDLHSYLLSKLTEVTGSSQTPQLRQLLEFGEGDNILLMTHSLPEVEKAAQYSHEYEQIYCNPELFINFCADPPINLSTILPFEPDDIFIDAPNLLQAEQAILVGVSDKTINRVLEAYVKNNFICEEDRANLQAFSDYFDEDFYEVIGTLYSNIGKYKCALRWYHEFIRYFEKKKEWYSLSEDEVYASVGYCLYALGFYGLSIVWTKYCISSKLEADLVSSGAIGMQCELLGTHFRKIERVAAAQKFTISGKKSNLSHAIGKKGRKAEFIKNYLERLIPNFRVILTYIEERDPKDNILIKPQSYPFRPEFDGSAYPIHKTNLILSLYSEAITLAELGYIRKAKRLLGEGLTIEPNCGFILEMFENLKVE